MFKALTRARLFLRREQGATAVEFGLIAFPFLLSLAMAFAIGMNFYMAVSLDYATRKAARSLMTGATQTGAYSASQFQTLVCNGLSSAFTCSNLFVSVSALTAPAYVSSLLAPYHTPYYAYLNASQSGLTTPALNAASDGFVTSGSTGSCWLIVVEAVYPAPYLLSFFAPSSATIYNGAKVNLLMSSATFMTEPYPGSANTATTGC